MEFLVRIEIALPAGMDPDERTALVEAEAARGKELRAAGTIVRIWRVPGRTANVGIWSAADATELHAAISSLPQFPWMSVTVEPLATHYLERDDTDG
jgi:muconolactone D-isomerase